MNITNTTRFDATITNEITPQLRHLVDAIKAGEPTDQAVSAVAAAVASGVRKAIYGIDNP